MEMRSYSQSLVASLICLTMLAGVIVGPEGKRRGSFWPEASILTFVPPTSMTRILWDLAFGAVFIEDPWLVERWVLLAKQEQGPIVSRNPYITVGCSPD